MPNKSWLVLNPKIRNALATALTLDGGSVIAWLNGSITGRQAIVAIVGLDLPVFVGYMTPAPVTAAMQAALAKVKRRTPNP